MTGKSMTKTLRGSNDATDRSSSSNLLCFHFKEEKSHDSRKLVIFGMPVESLRKLWISLDWFELQKHVLTGTKSLKISGLCSIHLWKGQGLKGGLIPYKCLLNNFALLMHKKLFKSMFNRNLRLVFEWPRKKQVLSFQIDCKEASMLSPFKLKPIPNYCCLSKILGLSCLSHTDTYGKRAS